MSRVGEVIKNRNRVERTQKARRKEEIQHLKQDSAFKARLYDELKKIDMILDSDEVESVVITIPDIFMSLFSEAIYSEDLAEYDVQQKPDTPNQFYIRHRMLQF